MNIIENEKKYIAQTYHRLLTLKSGNGSVLLDDTGKTYTDLTGGIAVNQFGYNDLEWVEAVTKQAALLQHTSNYFNTYPQNELAMLLCEKSFMNKVFFSNSGAEANECAIKCARKYSFDKYGRNRSTIITMKNSFHGRTVTTLSATGQDVFHNYFFPFTEGFVHVSINDTAELLNACDDTVCAIMIEVIQGEGGVNELTAEYLKSIEKICNENDILLIVDEVQTGNGRTGKYFSYMHYDLKPDIVTTAKGLGGGLPIGATLFNEKTCDVFGYGSHGSTFGGNPICAAGACSIVKRIDDLFLDGVNKKSEFIINELSSLENVESITGKGLLLGIKLKNNNADDIIKKCIEKGVLLLTAKEKLRIMPPLNIPLDQLKKALNILKEVIENETPA